MHPSIYRQAPFLCVLVGIKNQAPSSYVFLTTPIPRYILHGRTMKFPSHGSPIETRRPFIS